MISRLIRRFADKVVQRTTEEQIQVINRFTKELEKELPQYEQDLAEAEVDTGSEFGEFGYRVKGPEPTRYGDWEIKGRVSDF
ncbi:unnamed protein product [Blepharisma stoltei]|uniref:Succinate dehydrogenase assembly factor 4, mitochondrial n=1 Tax=Blepharisma stoltei TaxID=1481888 RepID=A0AAU9KBD4_9CILI|nr:unnamed protein product [Blepharisma stoltei]